MPRTLPATLGLADAELDEGYLLVLEPEIGPDSVEALAVSRFASARWEVAPDGTAPGRPDAAGPSGPSGPSDQVAVLRLSRHTTVRGPYVVPDDVGARLGLPADLSAGYLVRTLRERGEPPFPGGGDRDGLGRAFPDGLPVREEARVVSWLVAVARRLGGAVRMPGGSALLTPDPDASVDLTVFTDVWLEPEAALAVVRRALPAARLATQLAEWSGPPAGTGTVPAPGAEGLAPELRRWLHAEADAFDAAALSQPVELHGYGVVDDRGPDGALTVEVEQDEFLPLVLAGLDWAQEGAVAYHVRWFPVDDEELEREKPSAAHRVARSRILPHVAAVTRQLYAAVRGEIVDGDAFLVDPEDL